MTRLFGKQVSKGQRDELLSAYLDGQQDAAERARLEAQLATDPALRAELEALRRTVTLVRDLPPVPVPHNFILPQTAAARLRPVPPARPRLAWAAPLLTAATAVTSLLFIVVLAGSLLFPGVAGGRAFIPAAAPPPEAPAPQMVLEPSPASQEAATEDVEAAPSYGGVPTPTPLMMKAPPEATGAERSDEALPEGTAPPTPALPIEGGAEVPPPAPTATMTAEEWEEMAYAAPSEAPETAPVTAVGGGAPTEEVEEPAAAPTAPPAAATAATEEDRGNAEPTPSQVAEVTTQAFGGEETVGGERGALEGRTSPPQITPWLVFEIVLGLISFGLGLATILAWRARRR